jgi:5-methylcytosine-specific restriction protein A
MISTPKSEDFQAALDKIFEESMRNKLKSITVVSGELHRKVGGYPGSNHRMPICCSVMKKNIKKDDKIIYEPPSGKGATLKIEYKLPRP